MIRRPPRSTQSRSSAASDVYKRQMYKKARMYDEMIRLVSTFRKDLLLETHLHLAQQLEGEGNYKQAEQHFAEAKDWKAAVNMYRVNNICLLYTSPSPRDRTRSRMPSSA
eukprot:TRINITY_DN20040_c0_g1_i1.p1 TRINITY_DN20040_c0_g1~~TRINITY_DN20040_c0_g1_i1.p1  ORF type:complete len:110 (-),score=72.58 TRINITY_DN20040_c0_g1_i1:137-466(-)